uniref:Ferritin n=1 Tax=Magallana gigas TaxID=29159 RepID=A0A8W8JW36_MAGGI
MAESQCRQNYHQESEAGINRQINMELYACYTYQSMAYYFDRDDVALPGFSKFFKNSSDEEREHAEKLMKYQSLLDLHKVADSHKDAQMCDFLETHYLEEQVNAIKEISDHITQLKRVGSGLGEYEYDRRLDS